MKTCTKCKTGKPVDEFYLITKRGRKVRDFRCKECKRATNRQFRMSNAHSERQRHREYAQRPGNRTKIRAKCYEMTVEQYEALMAGGCAIAGCVRPAENIDHDHECCPGKKSCGRCVRGALCGPHNRGLGCFDDDPEALRAAADYLVAITAAETPEPVALPSMSGEPA